MGVSLSSNVGPPWVSALAQRSTFRRRWHNFHRFSTLASIVTVISFAHLWRTGELPGEADGLGVIVPLAYVPGIIRAWRQAAAQKKALAEAEEARRKAAESVAAPPAQLVDIWWRGATATTSTPWWRRYFRGDPLGDLALACAGYADALSLCPIDERSALTRLADSAAGAQGPEALTKSVVAETEVLVELTSQWIPAPSGWTSGHPSTP